MRRAIANIRNAGPDPAIYRQSSSVSRVTAGAFGFLSVTLCGARPDRWSEPSLHP